MKRRSGVHWLSLLVAVGTLIGLLASSDFAPIPAQVAAEPPGNTGDDLKKALKSGKPVLADFGANKCVPCRQIRPILREIEKEYAGKAHVLILDVWVMPKLAREYRIQLIPTLVFWDPEGKEVFRRSGVWDKDSMVQKLKEAGMEE